MPPRKRVSLPKKRKRRSDNAPRGPAPFGTQAAQAGSSSARLGGNTAGPSNNRKRKQRPTETRIQEEEESTDDDGRKRRRMSPSEAESNGDDDELGHARFAFLQPRQRSVKQAIVKNKWETLNEKAQETIRNLFEAVEKPLISVHREEKRRVEAQAALGQLMKTLHRRLPRMPFPKDSKDWHFDQEALMASNRALEASTTSQQHAISLLKAEIREQELLVESDEAELRELEKNAKKEARLRQAQSKRHPLLVDQPEDIPDSAAAIRLAPSPRAGRTVTISATAARPEVTATDLDSALDPSLQSLVKQLANHLESLETNAAQAAGIDAYIVRAATKLDAVLSQKLSEAVHQSLPAAL